jgi:hypothetical protein
MYHVWVGPPNEGSVLFGSAGGVAKKGAGKTGVYTLVSNFAYAKILRSLLSLF